MRNTSSSRIARALLALLLSCGGAGLALAAGEDAAMADDGAIQTVDVGTLPPQELAAGQCGLFLWTNSSEPRLVFMNVAGGEAHMVVNGQALSFVRNAAEGQEYLGQFESQNFYSPAMSVSLTMDVERRPNIVDGAVVTAATLRLVEANGWETVIPVGGLIGCGAA